jgi:hypothetical protein
VHEERLAQLPDAALIELHRAGYLQPTYMAIASLGYFRDLIDRVRRRRAQAG